MSECNHLKKESCVKKSHLLIWLRKIFMSVVICRPGNQIVWEL